MSNRILEMEIAKLRRLTADLTNDLTMLRKTVYNQTPSTPKEFEANSNGFKAHERESLIAQLETKSMEVKL